MIFQSSFTDVIFVLMSVIISLTVHEYSHGYVAYKCGDDTARNFGRLTLNPLKHLDIFGFLSMLLVGFGWAKPVPINIRNFRKPRRDIALVSIAGPASNFILGLIGVILFRIFLTLLNPSSAYIEIANISVTSQVGNQTLLNIYWNFLLFFYYFSILNIGLGLFNLIPIPPLDGSKILSSLLPPKLGYKFLQLERYAGLFILILFALSYISSFSFLFTPIEYLREWTWEGYNWLVGLLPFIY